MKKILLSLCACCLAAMASAQLRWQPVDSFNHALPASVRVYGTTDSLDGRPFRAFYLTADLKDKRLQFLVRDVSGKRYTPRQFYEKEGPDAIVVVNASFFSFKENKSLCLVISKGKVLETNPKEEKRKEKTRSDSVFTYYPTRGSIGFFSDHRADIAWVYNVGKKNIPYAYPEPSPNRPGEPAPAPSKKYPPGGRRWKPEYAVGGGPVLVMNGKVEVTDTAELMSPADNVGAPRTAVGYTPDQQLIILVIQGRMPGVAAGVTLRQEARIMQQLGCIRALNLDGGGSSCMLVNGKETIKPSDKEGERPVPTVLMIKEGK